MLASMAILPEDNKLAEVEQQLEEEVARLEEKVSSAGCLLINAGLTEGRLLGCALFRGIFCMRSMVVQYSENDGAHNF